MNIIFVFVSSGLKANSVQMKIVNQIKGFRANGINCKGVFFTTDDFDVMDQTEYFTFVKVTKIPALLFRSTRQRTEYHKKVFEYFSSNSIEFDLIYYRYSGAHKYLMQLVKLFPKKVIIEHVTAETREIKMYSLDNPFRFKLSSILGRIEFLYLPLVNEFIYGRAIRTNALFGVCNSNDIAIYEKNIAKGKYNTIIVGDAVNVGEFVLNTIPPLNGELTMIFLKGASTTADFNGLDRVILGINGYKGEIVLKLLIYGKNLKSEEKLIDRLGLNEKVLLNDFAGKNELDNIFKNIHLGIGAMAVHRKGLKSTTTIKNREYFARGLPFIYGHNDPDLLNILETKKFCLELDSSEEPVNFEAVISWYKSINRNIELSKQMRDFAIQNLDYKIKTRRIIKYINHVI